MLAWIQSSNDVCTEYCCCVITFTDTQNFCPKDSEDTEIDTILNCYHLQSQSLNDMLAQIHDQGNGVFNIYSMLDKFLIWRHINPVYGYFKNLTIVIAINIVDSIAFSIMKVGNTLQISTIGIKQSLIDNSGDCVFNEGNQTGIICDNNINAQISYSLIENVRVNYAILLDCIAITWYILIVREDNVGECIFNKVIKPIQTTITITIKSSKWKARVLSSFNSQYYNE